MSDEEAYSEEEAEAEEAKEEKPKPKPAAPAEAGVSEAQAAIEAAKARQAEEDEEKLKEYEEQRRIQREKEDEELRQLKEKQEKRRREREEEDRQMAERRKAEEERRKQEEEERKAKMEADKRKKEEEKKKRQQMMAGLGAAGGGGGEGGANFVIPKKDAAGEKFDKLGNIMQAKNEMGLTKEQQEERKADYIAKLSEPIDTSGLDVDGLRAKVKELHGRICKLEADRYDLEKRHERQEYDLKELNERQRQINRNKALKKGLDPDAANSRHPPKIATASKYDRQIDRRSYGDRRELYESSKKEKGKAVFHGSCRPPTEWGRKTFEELDNIRKMLEPPKYVELAPVEGAKPPMAPVPAQGIPQEAAEEEE